MGDNFDFDDDNDDILLSLITKEFCDPETETTENITPSKRKNQLSDGNIDSIKKHKSNDSISPSFEETIITDTTHSRTPLKTPNAVKRIFPGPAGILAHENVNVTPSQSEICTQNFSSIFLDGPWEEMSKDFKVSNSYLHEQFNIAWIKTEAAKNQFVLNKAPFLAGILLSLEVSDGQTQKSVNITLKDTTGTIQGNILHTLYEEYASHFTLGAVLILVQFGVLSCTCDKCDNHYLTITPKNLCAIYNSKEKIVIQKIDPHQVLKYFNQQKEKPVLRKCNNISEDRKVINRQHSFLHNKAGIASQISNKTLLKSASYPSSYQNVFNCSSSPKMPTPGKSNAISSNQAKRSCSDTTENYSGTSRKLFSFKKCPSSLNQNSLNSNLKISNEDIVIRDRIFDQTRTSLESESSSNVMNLSSDKSEQDFCSSSPKTEDCLSSNNSGMTSSNRNFSIKGCNSEHEQLWKDALNDLDINSLFSEEF